MIETFEDLCKRVDDMLRNKPIMPSAYLVALHEYDKWKSDNRPEKNDDPRRDTKK